MKKIIYTSLVAIALIVSVSACTEETVAPAASKVSAGGGSGMESAISG